MALWGGSILCGWLILRSILIWNSASLNLELDVESNFPRNQFAGSMAYLVPFAAAYAWKAQGRIGRYGRYIPIATLGLALLYSGSRGGTIATALGLIVVVGSRARVMGWFRTGRRAGLGLAILVCAVWGFVFVSGVDSSVTIIRWVDLYDPAAVSELRSYEARLDRAMNAIDLASQKPIFGWGLGAAATGLGSLPHNDYLTVLAELGIIGEVLLVSILAFVAWRLFRPRAYGDGWWVLIGSQGAFVAVLAFMMTMDRVYSTTAFWIVVAMVLIAAEYNPKPKDRDAQLRLN